MRICSLYFRNDSYILANSPEFLKSIEFSGKRRLKLKDDAVPTEHKPLDGTSEEQNVKRSVGTLSRRREVEDILNADTVAENANVICEQPIHSESHEEILTVTRNETICESFMPQEPVTVTIKSSYTQTDEQFVNQWPKKNKMTQTCKLPATVTSNKTKTMSKKTQTYLTNECLLQYVAAAKPKVLVCSSTQTALIENELVPNTSQPELDSDPIDKHSSSDEEYQSDESDLESDEGINGDRGELITLSSNKPPHDQMKFIVFEESIVKRFGSTEVKNSTAMELESLKRQLAYLEQSEVNVKKLVTGRHSQVSSYLAQEKPDIDHAYDVWHVAKEPVTLVEKYLDGKQPKPKSDIVAAKHSRFTQPALPGVDEDHCDCSGKCATRRCKCKNELRKCKSACDCKKEACKNV
ncbi:Hypothetical predicted protein [Paramuricea clavata]|uniref:Uncharacterized protein n=1 Tax=Paramuricea clavata TaxID=317549 RepID=A0A7D9DC53_PARCT|nr:Hypothetical predicted protein [Paramuricea clavata]